MSTDSEFFYEREAEHFGFTPFQFLDLVGEIVVKIVFNMFDRVTVNSLIPHAPFLSKGQIDAVIKRFIFFLLHIFREWDNGQPWLRAALVEIMNYLNRMS